MEPITVTDTSVDGGKVVCEQLEINLLPANLLRWQGGDAIREALSKILAWADDFTEPAKGVFIVDSVYEAKRIAEELRTSYALNDIGEVHGYMDPHERSGALQRRLSVGTTTIDVGVDLTGNKSKNFLVGEARSPAQAIQRIGRLGRGGRAQQQIDIPNRAWLAVPDYVYQYIRNRVQDGSVMKRNELNELLNKAYLGHENFLKYTVRFSPQEAAAACERIQQQFHKDTQQLATDSMHLLVPTLYAKQPPGNQAEAEKVYKGHLGNQLRTWRNFGTKIQGISEKARNKHYLADLESFRGGMESDFTVIIYDELDKRLGLKPIKTYNLPFVLRRTVCEEVSRQSFIELVQRDYPAQAEEWVSSLEHPRPPLGYIHVKDLIVGKANEVYFELDKSQINGRFQQVIRLEGIALDGGSARLLTSKESINGRLKKNSLNCWVSERNSFKLSEGYSLPPLFSIYQLHALNLGGKSDTWSIAFGLDAFFLSCIARNYRLPGTRSDDSAIII